MKKIIIILLTFATILQADVLLVENDFIHFKTPPEFKKLPSVDEFNLVYVDASDEPVLVVHTFRGRKMSDWHLRGLSKSTKSLQKFFDTELGANFGEKIESAQFDDKEKILKMRWSQPDGSKMLSHLKLTSFGCIGVHVPLKKGAEIANGEKLLNEVTSSLKIPAKFNYIPENILEQLYASLGGGFYFIIISLLYLIFSLHQRSLLRNRRQVQKIELYEELRQEKSLN